MSLAIVFAGQGMQHPQMLPWLAEDVPLVDDMKARLGAADWRGAMADPDWGSRNVHAQLLLTGLSLAAWQQLADRLPRPAAVAGYSVGELPAFAAAGVFDAHAALQLAASRAAAMDRCPGGGLIAVSGLAPAAVAGLGLDIAIENGFDALVLGGAADALQRARGRAEALGAHVTPLRVEVPSHTPAMQPAADEFARRLQDLELQAPALPLFANADAERVWTTAQAARALAAQIACTVRWAGCMDQIRARGVSCVLELGPGAALARLWNQRHPDVPARSADEFRSAAAIVDWVGRQQRG